MNRLPGLCWLLLICNWYQVCNGNLWKIADSISCSDPSEHVRDVTYGQLEQIFQGYFAYDVDLFDSSSYTFFSLYNKCTDVKKASLVCKSDRCTAQHMSRWCYGQIRDCDNILNGARDVQICHADVDSDRRYEWMRKDQSKEKADYGVYNRSVCYSTQGMMTDFAHLLSDDICICNCESPERNIDRYFSLRDVLSDENKVVTGAKLTLDNHVFHIQIQQGTLGPNGKIIDKPEWKKVDSLSKAQLLAHNISRFTADFREDGVIWYKNDLVYSVTYEQSIVYLDDLEHDEPNRLVTGLRFQQVGDNLRLEVQTSPFDYATGKLDRTANSWTVNDKGIDQRKEVILASPGNPAQSYQNDDVSSNDQYIRFKMTDLVKDVGSWTVPFIDLQEIVTIPPIPLVGVGLMHRGTHGSGGFLALKLLLYESDDQL